MVQPKLVTEQNITLFSTLADTPVWEIVSGNEVIEFVETAKGITIKSLASGEAVIKVTCGNKEKEIQVTVTGGKLASDINFVSEGIVSGNWYQSSEGLIGNQIAGDGFILSTEKVKDCYYTAHFDLGTGAAAALVLRANSNMSEYILINYDRNGRIVKVWTQNGELLNVFVGDVDTTNITLSAILKGTNGEVILNGRTVGTFTLKENDPTEGYLGLNICATEAIFKSVTLLKNEFEYSGNSLNIRGNVNQYITKIINITQKNTLVDKEYYKVSGRDIIIDERYFQTLPTVGLYEFEVVGEYSTFRVKVNVTSISKMTFDNQNILVGENLNIYLANLNPTVIKINGKVLASTEYSISNKVLTIASDKFTKGENTLEIDGEVVIVNLNNVGQTTFKDVVEKGCGGSIITSIFGAITLLGASIVLRKKRG